MVILLIQMEAEHVHWNSTFAHHVRIVIPVQGQLLLLSSKLSKVSRKAENSFELYSRRITSDQMMAVFECRQTSSSICD